MNLTRIVKLVEEHYDLIIQLWMESDNIHYKFRDINSPSPMIESFIKDTVKSFYGKTIKVIYDNK
jgi:hypothetical protein